MTLPALTHQTPITAKRDPASREFMQMLDEYRRKIKDLEARIEALEP